MFRCAITFRQCYLLCVQVLAHQRHLEHIWHTKKVKLHQRLGLRLFQQDVKQVRPLLILSSFHFLVGLKKEEKKRTF